MKLAAYQYDAGKHSMPQCAVDDLLDSVSQCHLCFCNISFYEKPIGWGNMESSICKSKLFLSDMDLFF